MYWAFKHFGSYVEPGAFLPRSDPTGTWSDVLAFKNPDGRIVVVMQNDTSGGKPDTARIAGQTVSVELPVPAPVG
jgi:hypothetical protein